MKLWRNRHLDNSLGKNIHIDTRNQTDPRGRGSAFLTTWGPWTVDDLTFDLWRVKRRREWENGVAKWEESIINQWVMGFRQCWPLLPALSVSQHCPNIQPESCYSFKHQNSTILNANGNITLNQQSSSGSSPSGTENQLGTRYSDFKGPYQGKLLCPYSMQNSSKKMYTVNTFHVHATSIRETK